MTVINDHGDQRTLSASGIVQNMEIKWTTLKEAIGSAFKITSARRSRATWTRWSCPNSFALQSSAAAVPESEKRGVSGTLAARETTASTVPTDSNSASMEEGAFS